MDLFFFFSGEHPELPKAELLSVFEGERVKYRILKEYPPERLLVLRADTIDPSFAGRLALTKNFGLYVCESRSLKTVASKIYEKIQGTESFKVKSESNTIARDLGGLLCKRDCGLKVNLENPKKEVYCSRICGRYFAGILIRAEEGGDFDLRKPQFRPFFHPTSMHPKIARLLVNLARVGRGDRILDPFCGTGGVLIEAGLMGMKVAGFDISKEMVAGCRENLKHYGINDSEIKKKDSLESDSRMKVDAIVTDPPYGRSSFVSDSGNMEEFYGRFILKAHGFLKSGGRMVIVLPLKYAQNVKFGKRFNNLGCYDIRVHKSLTRRIFALSKTGR